MGMPAFWTQFWPDLLATLIGAFFGVVLAGWFNRRQERAARLAEEEELLETVRDNLLMNLSVIADLRKTFAEKGKKIPTGQVDVGLLDAIFARFAQVSTDTQLTTWFAVFRHFLHHLNRRLDHLLEVAYLPLDHQDPIADVIRAERVGRMVDSIASTLPNIEKMGKDALLPRINARIGIAETPQPTAAHDTEPHGAEP